MLYYKFSIFQKDFENVLCHNLAHMYVLNSTEMNIKLNMFFHIFVYKQIDLHDPLRAYLFLFGFFSLPFASCRNNISAESYQKILHALCLWHIFER